MWDLWNMAFHRSLVFQVMPTFKSRLLNKGLFSEEDLNKALKGVLTNELSFRKASKVYGIPIGRPTLHRYKKKMHPGNTKVKKISMTTTQVSKFLLG